MRGLVFAVLLSVLGGASSFAIREDDSIEDSEPESFMSLPRFEIAFTTSTDAHGPIFHINSFAKSILLQYSLYNHFAIGVAATVIRKTFLEREKEDSRPTLNRTASLGLSASDPTLDETQMW